MGPTGFATSRPSQPPPAIEGGQRPACRRHYRRALSLTQARSSSAPISIDDVISAVDIEDITGDELGAIEGEKRRRLADIIDADQASGRRLALRLVEELIELRNA